MQRREAQDGTGGTSSSWEGGPPSPDPEDRGSGLEVDDDEKPSSHSRWGCSRTCCVKCIAPIVCVSILVIVLICIAVFGPINLLRWLLSLLPREPGWEYAAALCVGITIGITCILPIWPPLCMLSGLVFGVILGSVINFVAIFLAAILSFLIGRFLLREPIRDCISQGDYPRIRLIMLILEDEATSLKFMTLFRFLFIPMFIRNYGPSTLHIAMWRLILSAIPHSLWISILFASIGAAFEDSATLIRDGKEFSWTSVKWQHILIFVVALIVALLLMWFAHREYTKRLNEEDAEAVAATSGQQTPPSRSSPSPSAERRTPWLRAVSV